MTQRQLPQAAATAVVDDVNICRPMQLSLPEDHKPLAPDTAHPQKGDTRRRRRHGVCDLIPCGSDSGSGGGLHSRMNPVHFFPTLRGYDPKSSLLSDLNTGLILTAIVVPQAMAYAILAKLPPVTGIYMSIIQPLIYALLGTSPFISFGTFALLSMMVGDSISALCAPHPDSAKSAEPPLSQCTEESKLSLAASLTLHVGFIQLLMLILNVGKLAMLLDRTVVRAFSTAVAFHIALSQTHNFAGLPGSPHKTSFPLLEKVSISVSNFTQLNKVALSIGVASLILLTVLKMGANYLKRRHKAINIPVDLLVVLAVTFVCHLLNLQERKLLETVGPLPLHIPNFPPRFQTNREIWYQSSVLAVVSIAMHISFVKIFPSDKKEKRSEDNQEIVAVSLTNLLSSVFSCYPGTASLSRSMILFESGAKSQLSSLFASCLVAASFLVLRSFFQLIPLAVLAAVILSAVRRLWKQISDVPILWKECKAECTVWVITFSATILFSCEFGLLIGAVASMMRHLLLQNRALVSPIYNTLTAPDVFLDQEDDSSNDPYCGQVAMARIRGPVNALTVDRVVESLRQFTRSQQPDKKSNKRQMDLTKLLPTPVPPNYTHLKESDTDSSDVASQESTAENHNQGGKFLVIDFTAVPYVDYLGYNQFKEAVLGFEAEIILTCTDKHHVNKLSENWSVVPSNSDAVALINRMRSERKRAPEENTLMAQL